MKAGKILNDHGIPVAYKSDHAMGDTSAQYLLLQSAIGHSFGLPADKSLQAVTSVPAKALDLDDRVGYARPGYDADIVVWDSHPLSIGATPRQVFIDGVATLDPHKVEESTAHVATTQDRNKHQGADKPPMRATISAEAREEICSAAQAPGRAFVITGISKSFLDEYPDLLPSARSREAQSDNITLVVDDGQVTCLGSATANACGPAEARLYETHDRENVVTFHLHDGHLTRGLTAVTSALGLAEIAMDPATGDGVADVVSPKDVASSSSSSEKNGKGSDDDDIDHAKYGVSLAGGKSPSSARTFARARLGGVTRAVQAPLSQGGLITGVSTGLRTAARSTLLNGGLFREDVALHVALGTAAKANEGTVSMGVQRLRALVEAAAAAGVENGENDRSRSGGPWALVADGSLPLVIKADSSVSFMLGLALARLSFFLLFFFHHFRTAVPIVQYTHMILMKKPTTTARYPASHPVQEGFPQSTHRHLRRT